MPARDVVSNLFSTIKENELRNKSECLVIPGSSVSQQILRVMQRFGFIGEFEYIDDRLASKLRIRLLGRINNCGSIKPHVPVEKAGFGSWERRYLPAANIGILIVSTDKGIMSHSEATERNIGGRLLGYVY